MSYQPPSGPPPQGAGYPGYPTPTGPPPTGHPGYAIPPGPPQQQHYRAPSNAPQPGGTFTVTDTVGNFEGAQYRIDHRDSNSILHFNLQQGYEVKAKSGAMVTMQPTVQIKGNFKFSWKKMVSGGDMAESQFTGPGEVVLAPEIWGDVVPIQVKPGDAWNVGKDAFLACTNGVVRQTKSQGAGKSLFSGEGFFVGKISGQGLLFVQSLGAIIKRTLGPQEQLIVDNGHLVAWSATYKMERIGTSGGGMMSGHHTGEGLVCRFTGPGDIYIQTRNPEALGTWIRAQMPAQA